MIKEISVRTKERNEFVDVTESINEIAKQGNREMVTVLVPHTTAGITINEGADPDVQQDILQKLEEIIPEDRNFRHSEGNSDAHIKTSLMGNTLNLIVQDKEIVLGRWQKIFFCEFDGPRQRKIIVKI